MKNLYNQLKPEIKKVLETEVKTKYPVIYKEIAPELKNSDDCFRITYRCFFYMRVYLSDSLGEIEKHYINRYFI